MSKFKLAIAGSLALSALAAALSAASLLFAIGVFDASETRVVPRAFENQARAYILRNPEVIVEAFRRMEERQQVAEANELRSIVAARRDEIFNDPTAPVAGNPEGDVTIVEFFDYNCPYCREAAPLLAEVEESDDGLRFVYKEFPILGPGSEFAARAALASQRQGKYEAFHQAMMAHSGAITERSTIEIAEAVGLDIERLRRDMEDSAIAETIKRNITLAQALRISGTPTFIVGDEIVRGLVDLETMERLITQAREQVAD
ncbi:DsbA family protein [Inquilinus sp. CAU 1745]|uniref:DsbA family protein n=1 Tax=Inquilinus sp. CAU 1745 TaxID=3140369 RepID=UPI00325A58A5